jgi:hypothetical protein
LFVKQSKMTKKVRISKHVKSDYERLLKEVSEINGIIYHHNSIINVYKKQVPSWNKKAIRDFYSGSHFVYHSPYDGKLLWGDFYTVKTKNFAEKIDLIARKTSNYHVSSAYESFEKFLRSITARIIINNRKKAELVDKELGFSSYNSCLIYLQKKYKNNTDIVSLLSNLNDDLKSSFKK